MSELEKVLVGMNRDYIRALNRDLAQQNSQGAFARNVTAILSKALANLSDDWAGFDLSDREDQASALSKMVGDFIQAAVKHNRSSCAMSNFPDEHNPSSNYIAEVILTCDSLCQEFLRSEFEALRVLH